MSVRNEEIMQQWDDALTPIFELTESDIPSIAARARKIKRLLEKEMAAWAIMDHAHTVYTAHDV